MRTQLLALLAAASISLPAQAVNTENYQIPYLGLFGSFLITDGARDGDTGVGPQANFGVPIRDGSQAFEVTFFDLQHKRNIDGKKNFQTGIVVDYVKDFGLFGWDRQKSRLGMLPRFKPFWLAGIGFTEEDVFGDKHTHPLLEGGAGVLVPFGPVGWAFRGDVRASLQINDKSADGTAGTSKKSQLLDFHVNLGLQLPLTWFFDRHVPIPPPAECEIAVVDPETGRTDCRTDTDRDGVADEVDACPGTASATPVDKKGCPKPAGPADSDGDGVADKSDKCPDTQLGIKVDATGCAVTQSFNLYGVTFTPDSAELTDEGRATLDGVAQTLLKQKNLSVEIAGHTDSIGSEAYNQLLSQQRAEAVRAYLVERGVAADSVTAAGYGESQPLAANDSEEGRTQNRRVEFRILAQ